jgi:hypothetical protein
MQRIMENLFMTRKMTKRLAIFGLVALSSYAAALSVEGEFRFDGNFTVGQKMAAGTSAADASVLSDSLSISRARLDISGDLGKNWSYGIRAEINEYENAQLSLDYRISNATLVQLAEEEPYFVSGSFQYVSNGLPALQSPPSYLRVNNITFDDLFSRVYAVWNFYSNHSLKVGRIGAPEITADHLYYKPSIGSWPNNKSIGSLIDYSGNHAGASVEGAASFKGTFGYSLGVWQQTSLRKLNSFTETTPVSQENDIEVQYLSGLNPIYLQYGDFPYDISTSNFDAKSLRLGYAARLSFAPEISGAQVGIGVGYHRSPLNIPVVVGTVETFGYSGEGYVPPVYTLAAFNTLNNWTVDAAAVFGAVQVNAGFQQQSLKFDVAQGYAASPATTTSASAIFSENGKATAWWVEAGYLLMGHAYKFDALHSVVSGVKLHEGQAGLEISARIGGENRKNVSALLSQQGYNDFSYYLNGEGVVTGAGTMGTPLDQAYLGAFINDVDGYLLISVDNTGTGNGNQGPALILSADKVAYQTKTTGYAINLNYYVDEHTTVKAEFEQKFNKFQRMSEGSVWTDSYNSKSVSTLRVRGEFMF